MIFLFWFINELYYFLGNFVFGGNYNLGPEEITNTLTFAADTASFQEISPICVVDFLCYLLTLVVFCFFVVFTVKLFISFIKYLIQ